MASELFHQIGFTSVKDLNPRAEAFKMAFQGQLKTINRSLQETAMYADPQWHKEKAKARNELLRAYGSALVRYLAQPAVAYPVGEKVLQQAHALAEEVSRFSPVAFRTSVSDPSNVQTAEV